MKTKKWAKWEILDWKPDEHITELKHFRKKFISMEGWTEEGNRKIVQETFELMSKEDVKPKEKSKWDHLLVWGRLREQCYEESAKFKEYMRKQKNGSK